MSTQSGQFEQGTYGFPISILLSAPPEAVIKLDDVTKIELTLLAPNSVTPIVNARNVTAGGWVTDPSPAVSDTIKWTVAQGDHPIPGRYAFTVMIDSDGGTKHLVTEGTYLVT